MRTTHFLFGFFFILALTSAAVASSALVRFQCHLKDVDMKSDKTELLEFTHEVPTCESDGSGVCFVPIARLKTGNGCRDFVASYDMRSEPVTLDVSLWPYCGASKDPDGAHSQTVSIPIESKRFQLTAEWGHLFLALACDRM